MIYVLYHGNCPDGFTAAWAAWKALGDGGVAYQAVNYGSLMPAIPDGARVCILDFSYPRAQLEALAARCEVTVLDHHKTAFADLAGLPFARFDMTESGASLTWDFFHGKDDPRPPLVEYVKDRDLWAFLLPGCRAVSQYIRMRPYAFEAWNTLHHELCENLADVVREGEALLAFQDNQVEIMTAPDRVRWIVLGRQVVYAVPVANATCFFSEVGERLCERYPQAPFAAYYFDQMNDQRQLVRQWGLRRRNGDVDVSAVAKEYGGGGHAAAAGWVEDRGPEWRLDQSPLAPWL